MRMPTDSEPGADPTSQLRLLDAHVVTAGLELVRQVKPADLSRATPCASWDLGALLAHMTAQHHGFAAAAAGRGAELSVWQVRPVGDDPAGVYSAAVEEVLAAFADPQVGARDFAIPEITTEQKFPAPQAIGFHLVDYVVHGWDVARALDLPFTVAPEALAVALTVAQMVPTGAPREAPDAMFGPVIEVAGDASPIDQIVALLGRDPHWSH